MTASRTRAPGRALRAALHHVADLSDRDRVRLYEALVEILADDLPERTEQARLARDRADAIIAVETVAGELNLAVADLTARDFTETCRRLSLDWNATRVGRLWGTWRNALNIAAGATPADADQRRAIRQRHGTRQQARQDPVKSLRTWLEGQPVHTGMHAYNGWKDGQNRRLPPGAVPHLSAEGIASRLHMTFSEAVRSVRSDLNLNDEDQRVNDEQITVRGDTLITSRAVGLMLGLGHSWSKVIARSPGFPPHVATVANLRLWRRDDVEAYHRGRRVWPARHPQHGIVLGAADVATRLGATHRALFQGLARRSARYPQPDGHIRKYPWWDTQRLSDWLAAQPR